MSTNKTPNYNLNSWQGNENVKRIEFNENFTILDTKLKELETSTEAIPVLSGRVDDHDSTLNGLSNTVSSLVTDKLDVGDFGIGGRAIAIHGTDLNSLVNTGFFVGSNLVNAPNLNYYYVLNMQWDDTALYQLLWRNSSTGYKEQYFRSRGSEGWTPWIKQINTETIKEQVQAGQANISLTDTTTASLRVYFSTAYVGGATRVVLTPLNTNPTLIQCSVWNITDAYFDIYAKKTSAGTGTVNILWQAQPRTDS